VFDAPQTHSQVPAPKAFVITVVIVMMLEDHYVLQVPFVFWIPISTAAAAAAATATATAAIAQHAVKGIQEGHGRQGDGKFD